MAQQVEAYFVRINRKGFIAFCNDAFKKEFQHSLYYSTNQFSQITGVASSKDFIDLLDKGFKTLGNSFELTSNTAGDNNSDNLKINWQFVAEKNIINCIGIPSFGTEARNEAKTNRQILKAIFETTHSVKFFVAPDYSILFFNKKAYTNGLALHGRELKAGDSILLYAKDTKNEIDQHFISNFERALKGEIVADEQLVEYSTHAFWFESEYSPIYDNNQLIGIAITVSDITKRKELEQHKTDFIGIVSHELRTPVTSLKAYCQIIIQKLQKQEYSGLAGMLDRMNLQINRLTHIIKDLLDVTRIEGTKLIFREEVFILQELVIQTVEEVQRITETHKIIIETTQIALVYADKERIGQVLINLLVNAIRYSPKAQKILVNMNCNDSEVTCSIKDFGIGIPADKKLLLFERFYRVSDKESKSSEGLGLGLYIAQQIIQRQNGKLAVESEQGKGATFYFSLPITYRKEV